MPLLLCLIACYLMGGRLENLSAQDYIIDVQQFGVEDGLAHRRVDDIFTDKNGFLWIASLNNLQRYDGYEFRSYSLAGSKGGGGLWITDIGQDEEGLIWLVMANATGQNFEDLFFLNPLTGEVLSAAERLGDRLSAQLDQLSQAGNYVAYQQENKKELFFGTQDHIIVFDFEKGGRKIDLASSPFAVTDIQFIDAEGDFWVYDEQQERVIRINVLGKVLDSMKIAPIIREIARLDLVYGYQHVFEWNKDVYVLRGAGQEKSERDQVFRIRPGTTPELIFTAPKEYSPIALVDGQIWCISKDGWKVFRHTGEFLFELKQGDYDKQLFYALFPEAVSSNGEGAFIWSSAFGFSIVNVRKNRFTKYFDQGPGKTVPFINETRGIYVENDSVFVNFESGGLVLFQKEAPTNYKVLIQSSLKANDRTRNVPYMGRPIIRDKNDNFLIGQHFYWSKLSPDLLREEQFFHTLDSSNTFLHSWSIFEQEDDCIWSGQLDALIRKCPDEAVVTSFKYADTGFEVNSVLYVYQIQSDPYDKDLLWLCTNQGLYVFDQVKGSVLHRYHKLEEGKYRLPATDVFYMHVDLTGNRWLGTRSGLLFWDSTTDEKQLFSRNDGLANDVIYAVIEDDFNRLWLSSDYGVMSFDKETFGVQTYLLKDGIAHNEFNRISSFQAEDGTIYFGGINGVTAFHPKDFTGAEKRYNPIAISDYEIFSGESDKVINQLKEITETQTIIFRPDDRFFRLKFVLPTTDEKSKTLYAWKIEGVVDEWNYQKENSLQFGTLPYGNHTLRIKGQSESGGWSPDGLFIQVKVLKPFYFTNWFIGLGLLVFALGFYLFGRWRTALLVERQKILENEIEKATGQISSDKIIIKKQADGLRKLDKMKSLFFANISHEFRTPLTLILGSVNLALKRVRSLSTYEMTMVERNSRVLLRLINQILDLSKLEEGKMSTFYVKGNIIALLKRVTEPFEDYASLNNKNLTFSSSITELEMDYDKQKLEDIMVNLISNALKFTRGGDSIQVLVDKVGSQLSVTIKDKGIGIAKEDLPFLFDRYRQIESNLAETTIKGTGIGLSLVQQLVLLLEGEIKVESELGIGSTFTVYLPIRHNALQQDEELLVHRMQEISALPVRSDIPVTKNQDDKAHDEDEIQVLIVEDMPDLAQYIAACLPSHYLVSYARNGRLGIEKALEIIPDIIISDVMMPEKNGFELCAHLKEHELTNHIPIILLTAMAEAEARIKGLKRGADAYLAKPFEVEELNVRVLKLLEIRKMLRQKYYQQAIDVSSNNLSIEQTKPVLDVEDAFITSIQDIVSENYSDASFNVTQLIDIIGVSESQLRRKFRALAGVSPNHYIQSFRMKKAQALLEQSNLNIAEIAYKAGFNDPGYFSKYFLKSYGVSPSSYRKEMPSESS
jgi:signal transduction histidine kinase/AraC-like DNA-binding protein